MRISLNSIVVAALLGSIPFASVVRSYPTGEYIDIIEVSKRGFPKPGGRKPSTPPSNPFSTPFDTPSPPGKPAGGAAGWRNIANDDLKIEDATQDAMRIKGQELIEDLEKAVSSQSPSKKVNSLDAHGYTGQGDLLEVPALKIPKQSDPFEPWGIGIRSKWPGDDIKKSGSDASIVKTYEDPRQKAMIISKSYNKEQDKGGALSWTDMVMSNWHRAATKEAVPVSDLKYIIRNNIQMITTTTKSGLKLDTRAAIKGAFTAMNKKTDEPLTLDFNTANKVEMQQIAILSAQTHVARVLQMLKDYRGEFKDLKITKLHLQNGENNKITDYQYNIIIELGR
ncbi:hypothetical protein HBH98_045250 [Parastagonospora nodorum]|nr:hypothetical protein HBH51_079240 [Parastagonospora nodorum]KAH3985102.1 hypothetical protein HBH52_057250 [Parastagonospora nodorum]KAH4039404.1 hypothetical protein HBI09_047850 [Parastagonospora nodorum]KAH4055172.1 hypothetical protein HBH49_072360 [Parastagonospora nodorum]KAH4175503.1 hypothetical protein HBH43_063310 [Parastagonospora nodorum]